MIKPELLTKEELERIARDYEATIPGDLHRLLGHIAALEAENVHLRPSGQVAEDVEAVAAAVENRLTQWWMAKNPHLNVIRAGDARAVARDALHRIAMKAQMDALLRVGVPELEARFSSTCVWCGTAAPPATTGEALKTYVERHTRTCLAHPMRVLEADSAALMDLLSDAHGVLARVPAEELRPGHAECQGNIGKALKTEHPGATLLEEMNALRERAEDAETLVQRWQEALGLEGMGYDAAESLREQHKKTAEALETCREHVRQTGEDHRTELVRARNEGLEQATEKAREFGRIFREDGARRAGPIGDALLMAASGAADIANALDAMKGSED